MAKRSEEKRKPRFDQNRGFSVLGVKGYVKS